MKVIVIGVVLAVVGALGGAIATKRLDIAEVSRAAKENPYPSKSPMHAPFAALLAKLEAHPRLSQEIKKAGRGQQAVAVGEKISSRGLPKLDDRSLLLMIKLSLDILDQMDERACGLALKGKMGAGAKEAALYRAATASPMPLLQFFDALERVGAEKGGAYLELVYQALARGVDDSIAEREPHPSEVQAAMVTLVQGRISPEHRESIVGTISRWDQARNEDLCLAARALYANIGVTPDPHRRVILRYIAANTGG